MKKKYINIVLNFKIKLLTNINIKSKISYLNLQKFAFVLFLFERKKKWRKK